MLESRGNQLEADTLRKSLNKSVKKTYETVQRQYPTKIPQPKQQAQPKPVSKIKNYITLDDWKESSSDVQHDLLHHNGNKKFNKQEGASIEWAQWSWNPITGCKHPCPYCYARDIANRFFPTKFEPTLMYERLTAPHNMIVPDDAQYNIGAKNVFTGSMSDIFGKWIPSEWIQRILDIITDNPQWNFLFLSKFPIRMAEFNFPDNAWVGASVDCQARVKSTERAFANINAKTKWLSCEPMLEPLKFNQLDLFSWVVIGGASKSTNTPEWIPPRSWIHDLEMQAYIANCMIYEKTNLQPIERLNQYPEMPKQSKDRKAPAQFKYLPDIETE
jgi:protein gp37